jgi:hypothetical protein
MTCLLPGGLWAIAPLESNRRARPKRASCRTNTSPWIALPLAHARQLGAEGIVQRGSTVPFDQALAGSGSRSAVAGDVKAIFADSQKQCSIH